MEAYTWTFAKSFLVFLIIVFFSESLSTKLKWFLPMPLVFGVVLCAGFTKGLLPEDMLLSANMVSVGTIAFNVLIIHSGTMLDFRVIKAKKTETCHVVLCSLIMTVLLICILWPVFGRTFALLSPGAVIGGGASCAIGSRWITGKYPELSFYPWTIFMFQGLFAMPFLTWAFRKETQRLEQELPEGAGPAPQRRSDGGSAAVDRLPASYKTTAWYLGTIMVLTALNNLLHATLLKNSGVNPNITALLLGMLAANLGLIDKAPLFRSDTYGLLILSLMGLMANNLAHTPLPSLLTLVVPTLAALLIGTVILAVSGYYLGRYLKIGPYAGMILAMNSVMGYPVNRNLAARIAGTVSPDKRAAVEGKLLSQLNLSTALISNGLSVIIIGILVALI